jgi:hypothetical protein
MKVWEFCGKNVKVIDVGGRVFEGKVNDYTSELDNPNGKASMGIRNIVIYEDEIASIEELS